MPQPSSSLATLRPDLAASFMEFDLEMDSAGFIGTKIFPVLEVAAKSGNFGKIPVEALLQNRETIRGAGGGYNRGSWKFEPATYACLEHGLEEPVDDNEAEAFAEYFDAEQIATMRAFRGVLESQEKRIADLLFNATTFASYTTGITHEWDDATNATPTVNIEAAVQAVWEQSGLWPNTLVINRKVYRNLRNCDEIIDRVKYQNNMDVRAGNITAADLSAVFDLNVVVAGGTKNTATEGQSAAFSQIWSDEYAMVCRTATTNDPREACIGRIYHWSADGSVIGGTVEQYRDETVRANIYRVRHDVDEEIIHPVAGHLLSNVTTI